MNARGFEWTRTPGALAAMTAMIVAVAGCRGSGHATPDPAASGTGGQSAPPPPRDTSWEQAPGRLLAVKERAPNFEGIAHTGMRVRLSAFAGKPVVVFFYGADKSAEATAEVRGFRDAWMKFSPTVGMILGVSVDDRVLHRDFATAEELPFLLVSDEGGKIARAFGVPLDGGRSRATSFVLDKDGVVSAVFPAPNPEGHATEVLNALGAPR